MIICVKLSDPAKKLSSFLDEWGIRRYVEKGDGGITGVRVKAEEMWKSEKQ